MTTTTQKTGTVTRLINDRGFCFVRTPDGAELFMHYSALPAGEFDQLHVGDLLTFTAVDHGKGPRCENAQRLRP